MTKVLSVGGSIIVPDKPDTEFLTAFVKMSDSCCRWRRSCPRISERLQRSLRKNWC